MESFIGVFDSGIGGISVLRELTKAMPQENFLYYGDSANAPYGTKSPEAVKNLTLQAAEMLFARGAKALVVACNTATAVAIATLRETYPDKVIIGIEPAIKLAHDHFRGRKVGVLATVLTLQEEKFTHLSANFPQMDITPIPLPGLVELIEAGKDKQEIEAFLAPALAPYKDTLDAAVLGCTHYPLISRCIQALLGEKTVLLDGAKGTALQTKRRLEQENLLGGDGWVQMENSAEDKEILARCMKLLEEATL